MSARPAPRAASVALELTLASTVVQGTLDAWQWPPFALDLAFRLGVVLAARAIVARVRRR